MRAFVLLFACLSFSAVGVEAQPWCWNSDEVQVQVNGDQVRIDHLADLLNCCPDPITYDVLVGDVSIFVEEHSQSSCYCDCCFNLGVTLEDFPAGFWILRYRWFDIETGEWVEREFQLEIPDLGQPYIPRVGEQHSSSCLEAAGVSQEGPTATKRSWGRIKLGYR